MRKLYFIINGLHEKSGGVPKATIKRANLLAEDFDCEVTLFTLNYQKDFDKILQKFYQEERINKKVKVISLLNSYYGENEITKTPNIFTKLSNVFKKEKDSEEEVEMIYDSDYNLRAMIKNKTENTYTFIICKKGKELLKVNIINNKWQNITIINESKTFNKMQDFYKYTLDKLIDSDENNIITSDFRDRGLNYLPGGGLDDVVGSLQNIKKVAFVHTNHLKDKENIDVIDAECDKLFKNKNFTKYVVLTKEQKEDILEIYPNLDITVISNIVNFKSNEYPTTKRRDKMLFYGRYELVKNIPEMIDIFKLVVEQIPTFEFNLYGYGSQKDKIKKLISHPNIKLHDAVDYKELQKILKSHSFLLSTSMYEGQQMTLLEAFANELPFFTYPFKYGSKDITIAYDNGIMTDNRSKEEMANLIIKYIKGEFDFKLETKYETMYDINKTKKAYETLLSEI